MKIAIVGKGGSGKSTVSWLVAQRLLDQQYKVLAIDSDHNMDFIDLLGYEFTDSTPTFKERFDDILMRMSGTIDIKAREVINSYLGSKQFSLEPQDSFSEGVLIPYVDKLLLGVVGLGAQNVISGGKCSHNLSNPLKIYLSLLDEGSYTVVVDGVAGVDMINHGLYHACDYIIVVLEPARNSIKVAHQIQQLAQLSHLNYGFVINKYNNSDEHRELVTHLGDSVIGYIQDEVPIRNYDYQHISVANKHSIALIYAMIQSHQGYSLTQRLMRLEELKGPVF